MDEGRQVQPETADRFRVGARSRWVVAALAAFVLLVQLGARGLTEPDEGRYGSVAFAMYQSGDYLTPRLLGHAHFTKPPLAYWLMAAAYHLTGVNEFSSRLPAALAAWGCVLLTWSIARRWWGERAAHLAGVCLLGLPLFAAFARIADPNMLLTFFVLLANWGLVSWSQDQKPHQRWIFYLALALAMLTKGPVGLVLVLLPWAAVRLLRLDPGLGRGIWSAPACAAAVALGLSWYIVVCLKHQELWRYFLIGELYDRYFTESHGRNRPIWYLSWILLVGCVPWLPTLGMALSGLRKRAGGSSILGLLLCWILVPLVFFSLGHSKLPGYVLPVFPAVALLVAWSVDRTAENRWWAPIQLRVMGSLPVPVAVILLFVGAAKFGWRTTMTPMQLVWLVPALPLVAAVFRWRDRRAVYAYAGLWLVLGLFLFDALARHQDRFGHQTSCRGVGLALRSLAGDNDRVVSFRKTPRGILFYARRPVAYSASEFRLVLNGEEDRLDPPAYRTLGELRDLAVDPDRRLILLSNRSSLTSMPAEYLDQLKPLYEDGRFVLLSTDRGS